MIKQFDPPTDLISIKTGKMTIHFVSPYLSGMIVSLLNESDIEVRMITQQNLLIPFTINSKDIDNGLMALGVLFEDPSKISSSKVKIITSYKLCC